MRSFFFSGWFFAVSLLTVVAGCRTSNMPIPSDVLPEGSLAVDRIRISAITEFVPDPTAADRVNIKTLVELLNASGSATQAPCVLRFEFYEFHPRASDPRGRRLLIWPNQNLSDPDTNKEHWKEFLRGYEFFLPLEFRLERGRKYVLEATCLINQRRYSDFFNIQYQP